MFRLFVKENYIIKINTYKNTAKEFNDQLDSYFELFINIYSVAYNILLDDKLETPIAKYLDFNVYYDKFLEDGEIEYNDTFMRINF